MNLVNLINLIRDQKFEVIDLAQPLNENTPIIQLPDIFAQTPGFKMECISKYDDKGPAWYWNYFTMGEHVGTHFDAPCHWVTGKDKGYIDTIPAENFVGEAIVIDKTAECAKNPDTLLMIDDIMAFEESYGKIQPKSWVVFRTGWGNYAQDPEKFFNYGEDGMSHVPGFSKEAAEFLAYERDVLGACVETVGTDAGIAGTFDPPFPCHNTMHGAGKYGITQMANVDKLPPRGAIIIATPLKIENGSGSPVRPIAIVPR